MASRDERAELTRALENARGGTKVISYVTSTRGNLEVQMAMDAVAILHRHLSELNTPKEETRIDLFLHSNGGEGIVPWRIVTLIREFCSEFAVLVPHRAFSAATLMALGADRVIMHPMGMLGPTDPTVGTPFNPPNPKNPSENLGISVEDVASYISLVKEEVDIRHEEEVIQAFGHLARKIHPLALGSVKRATAQSRMMAEKLLRQRLGEALDEHELGEIIDKLTSQLYFHGHPINRKEARDDLRLQFVESASESVEEAMWNLYTAYADEMRLDEEWQPIQEAYAKKPVAPSSPPQLLPTGQVIPSVANVETMTLGPYSVAYIESVDRCDVRRVEFEITLSREWNGELGAKFSPIKMAWEQV